jgi:hypothetical protein
LTKPTPWSGGKNLGPVPDAGDKGLLVSDEHLTAA